MEGNIMKASKKVLVIHGPNLNLLGEREPGVYGDQSFENVNKSIIEKAEKLNVECEIFQSNHEGEIIDKLHSARHIFDGIVINAGAYTHYSYAIRDAISAIKIPCIEVHISNVFARESFRHLSYIAPHALGVISGFGLNSYRLALEHFARK